MALRVGRGIRPGTLFWRGPDHHDYHLNRRMAGQRVSLRCVRAYLEKCKGRASVDKRGQKFRQTTGHNHDADLHHLQVRAFRHELMARCRNGDNTRFKKMYHQVRRQLRISHQEAAAMPLVKLRSSMRRARLENRPNIPRSLKDFHKILRQRCYRALSRTLDGKDSIYAGRAGKASDRTIALVFVTKRMRRYMSGVRKIFCDGTFCPVPRGLKAHQVWTISTVRDHHVIPLVRVLMRTRTTRAYACALRKIISLSPQFNPEEIFADYELGEQRALRMAFPNAALHGCLFHYAKDVGLKARKLQMTRDIRKKPIVRRLVRWLCTLPLLPQDLIREGFAVVVREATNRRVMRIMAPLLQYWLGYWLNRLPVLSVYGCEDRSTNASEAENRMLQDSVPQKRPNVWDFMDGILELDDSTESAIAVLRTGRRATRKRSTAAVSNDDTIKGLSRQLNEGSISVQDFLTEASFKIAKSMNRGLNGRKRRNNI